MDNRNISVTFFLHGHGNVYRFFRLYLFTGRIQKMDIDRIQNLRRTVPDSIHYRGPLLLCQFCRLQDNCHIRRQRAFRSSDDQGQSVVLILSCVGPGVVGSYEHHVTVNDRFTCCLFSVLSLPGCKGIPFTHRSLRQFSECRACLHCTSHNFGLFSVFTFRCEEHHISVIGTFHGL